MSTRLNVVADTILIHKYLILCLRAWCKTYSGANYVSVWGLPGTHFQKLSSCGNAAAGIYIVFSCQADAEFRAFYLIASRTSLVVPRDQAPGCFLAWRCSPGESQAPWLLYVQQSAISLAFDGRLARSPIVSNRTMCGKTVYAIYWGNILIQFMDSAKNMKQQHAGKLAVYYLAVTLQLWFRAFLQLVFALFLRTGTNCLRETLVLVLLRYECSNGLRPLALACTCTRL